MRMPETTSPWRCSVTDGGAQGLAGRAERPPAAASAVILLCATMVIISVLNRIVDIRKEL